MLRDLAPLVDLMREGRKDASVTRRVINFWKGRSNATDGKSILYKSQYTETFDFLLFYSHEVGQQRLHAARPSAKCAGLPDSGFFIDYQDSGAISRSQSLFRPA